jgi:hypothetical protein
MIGVQISDRQSFVLVMSQKSGVAPQFLAVVAQGNPQRGTDLPMYLVGSVTACAPRSGGQRTARPNQARNSESLTPEFFPQIVGHS